MSRIKTPKNHPHQLASRVDQNAALFEAGSSSTDEVDTRVTDDKLFRELDAEFHFSIDLAASVTNTKCQRFYDREADGLIQDWDEEVGWCNPPYSQIAAWVAKASTCRGTVVMLLPANRTEQPWWHSYIEPRRDGRGNVETRFLAGRRAFYDPKLKSAVHMPFGAVIVIFRSGEPRE